MLRQIWRRQRKKKGQFESIVQFITQTYRLSQSIILPLPLSSSPYALFMKPGKPAASVGGGNFGGERERDP